MELFAGSDRLHLSVLLVSSSREMRAVLQPIAHTADLQLEQTSDLPIAAEIVQRERTPVLLVLAERGWQKQLRALTEIDPQPSVIVLMPSQDPAIWSEALTLGAFDAVLVSADRATLLNTIARAYRRWERRELVRTALRENPLYTAR